MSKYKKDEIIKCKVTGVEKYGIFVKVDKECNGLIHISEVSYDFVRNINDYVKVGDSIYALIIDVDDNNLKLSIKDIDYKNTGKKRSEMSLDNGFTALKEALPKWEEEYLNQIK